MRKVRPVLSTGNNLIYVNMQVQQTASATWNGPTAGPDRIVAAVSADPVLATFSTITFRATDSIWLAAAEAGLGLNLNPSGVPPPLSVTPSTAALFYGIVSDGGLPPNTETAPFLIGTGDSLTVDNLTIVIASIAVNFNDGTPSLIYTFGP